MKGKVALITGAAMGLGLACAERFARAGATTVLADIQFPEKQAELIGKSGYEAAAYKCDVSDEQSVRQMVKWIAESYGHLDAVVNNAGIQSPPRNQWLK